jgi:hypothetical protein
MWQQKLHAARQIQRDDGALDGKREKKRERKRERERVRVRVTQLYPPARAVEL